MGRRGGWRVGLSFMKRKVRQVYDYFCLFLCVCVMRLLEMYWLKEENLPAFSKNADVYCYYHSVIVVWEACFPKRGIYRLLFFFVLVLCFGICCAETQLLCTNILVENQRSFLLYVEHNFSQKT